MLFLSILNRIILESSYVRGIHNPTQQHNLDNIKIIGCKEQKNPTQRRTKIIKHIYFRNILKKVRLQYWCGGRMVLLLFYVI